MFHPGLFSSFEYVVKAQFEEFDRLYATAPQRIDGHHHVHLCANILLAELLSVGEPWSAEDFSFQRGDKNFSSYAYRRAVDRILARRHRLVDLFILFPSADRAGSHRTHNQTG